MIVKALKEHFVFYALADDELEKIIKSISKYPKAVRDNAGGAFNHALFWNMLSPTPKKVGKDLERKIRKEFGTFIKFKQEFEKIAKERFRVYP